MTASVQQENLHKDCLILYVTYAVSAVLQMPSDALMMGLSLLTLAIAGHMSKKKESAARGTPYESHLHWLYRTAWIASCVAIPVNLGLSGWLVWTFTDIGSILHPVAGGGPDALMSAIQSLQTYMDANMTKIDIFNMVGAAPPTVWWLHRCWRGYAQLRESQPVRNVKSWL